MWSLFLDQARKLGQMRSFAFVHRGCPNLPRPQAMAAHLVNMAPASPRRLPFSLATSMTFVLPLLLLLLSALSGVRNGEGLGATPMVPFIVGAEAAAATGTPIPVASMMLTQLTSHAYVTDNNLLVAGMDAAVHEVNEAGGILGRPLEMHTANTSIEDYNLRYTTFLDTVIEHAAVVVGSTFATDDFAHIIATESNVPIVASQTLDSGFFARRDGAFSATSLFIHQEISTEIRQLLNFAVRGRHRCHNFAVFTQGLDSSFFEQISSDLQSIDYPVPVNIDGTDAENNTAVYNLVRQAIENNSAVNLTCFIMLCDPLTIKAIIDEFNARDPDYRNVDLTTGTYIAPKKELFFFATSFSNSREFKTGPTDRPPNTATPYRFVYNTQSFPAADGNYVVAQKFRAAMDKVTADSSLRSVSHNVSGVMTPYLLPPISTYEHNGMLGYLTIRFASALLGRTHNLTNHDDLLATAYSSRIFPIDDFVLGPYSNGCVGQQTKDTGACKCNSGTHKVFTTRIGSAGHPVQLMDDPNAFEVDVAQSTIPMTECGITKAFTKHVAQAVIVIDISQPVDILFSHLRVAQTWATFLVNNRARLLMEVLPVIIQGENLTAVDIERMVFRFRLNSIVANPIESPGKQLDVWKVGQYTFTLPEKDAPYGPLETHDTKLWRVNPVLADTLHASMSFAASLGQIKKVHIYADTASALALAQLSLETFGGRNFESSTIVATDVATLTALPTGAEFIVIAVQKVAFVKSVHLFAIAAGAGAPTVIFAASEYVVEETLDNSTKGEQNPTLFVSALKTYGTGSATSAYGQLFGEVTLALANADPSGTGKNIDDTIFASGAIATASGTLRPLSRADCGLTAEVWPHPGGNCQCRKGLGAFYVRRTKDFLNQSKTTADVVHTYSQNGCGVSYTPYDGSLTQLQIMTIAAGCVIGVLVGVTGGVFLYFCFCRSSGRDNKNAPKDQRKPFAIVFTDIQASTTLWARAPQHMGTGLDIHHAVLRSLIAKHKGYEVKTIGDSFMVAFHTVEPATKFALDIQSALYDENWGTDLFDETYHEMIAVSAEDELKQPGSPGIDEYNHDVWRGIRVRVGVHFGTGNIRQDETSLGYDYYGTVVNTAARVEGVSHGGQVVLTKDAFDALTQDGANPIAPTTAIVTDLGPQPLRGLDEPVILHQLIQPRFAQRVYPPLRLDKEIVVDSSEDSEGQSYSKSGTGQDSTEQTGTGTHKTSTPSNKGSARSVSNREFTIEGLARETLRRTRSQLPVSIVVLLHSFTFHLFSTSTPGYRRGVIRHLGDKWRVPTHPSKWMKAYEKNDAVGKDHVALIQAVLRAVRAMDASSFGSTDQRRSSAGPIRALIGAGFGATQSGFGGTPLISPDAFTLNGMKPSFSRNSFGAAASAGGKTPTMTAGPGLRTASEAFGGANGNNSGREANQASVSAGASRVEEDNPRLPPLSRLSRGASSGTGRSGKHPYQIDTQPYTPAEGDIHPASWDSTAIPVPVTHDAPPPANPGSDSSATTIPPEKHLVISDSTSVPLPGAANGGGEEK